jgi:hypothetical protein
MGGARLSRSLARASKLTRQQLSWHDIAANLSRRLGREIKYMDVPPEAAKQSLMQTGLPEWQADAILALLADLKAGRFAKLTDTVEKIGHKTPITLEQFIGENGAALSGG